MMKRYKTFKNIQIVPQTTNGIQKCHPRGPMNVDDNMTTRKDNNKYETTNIIYDQNSVSIVNKVIKSNSHPIKPRRSRFTYTRLDKI